jgi:hypothetical protein
VAQDPRFIFGKQAIDLRFQWKRKLAGRIGRRPWHATHANEIVR